MKKEFKTSLSVFSAMVVKSPFDEFILPALIKEGNQLDIEWLPTTLILEKLHANQHADIIIASDEAIERLVEDGFIIKNSIRMLVNSSIGFATLQGAKVLDFSTTKSMISSLLSYNKISYSVKGLSGILFDKLIHQLSISDEIKKRAVLVNSGLTAERVICGDAELAIQQISELRAVKGVQIVGKIPNELNCHLSFSVGIHRDSDFILEAEKIICYFIDKINKEIYVENGLEPRY